jgi:DNA-binding GntR family transcriptional regulator
MLWYISSLALRARSWSRHLSSSFIGGNKLVSLKGIDLKNADQILVYLCAREAAKRLTKEDYARYKSELDRLRGTRNSIAHGANLTPEQFEGKIYLLCTGNNHSQLLPAALQQLLIKHYRQFYESLQSSEKDKKT